MNALQHHWKFALITPSYAPDFERCKLLVESVKHCLMDDTNHYIVVDRRDLQLFKPLASSRTHILVVEDLLPPWIFRVPGIPFGWMSLKTLPIRNWILQQLVKMAVCDVVNEEILVFCDSDNTFLHPFNLQSRLIKEKRLILSRINYRDRDVYEWIQSSKKLFGIVDQTIPAFQYVSNMIPWYRHHILAMRNRIEEVHSKHWIRAICQCRNISEYTLYAVFVEYIVGMKAANHIFSDIELMKPSWSIPLTNEAKVKHFFDHLEDSHIGVMIHSKHKIPIERYHDKIRSFW